MNLHKISAYLSQMSVDLFQMSVDLVNYLLKWLSPGFKQLSGLSVSLWRQSSRLHPLLACIRR